MLAFLIFIFGAIIFYVILYFIIKAAVRNGIIEARHMSDIGRYNDDDKEQDEASDDGNSISKITCPRCSKSHDMDYPKCPYCKYQYY